MNLLSITITPDRIQTFLILIGFISVFTIPSIVEPKSNKKQLHR